MRRILDRGAGQAKSPARRRSRLRIEAREGRQLLNAGDLDLSFGGTGTVATAIGTPSHYDSNFASDLAIQPDGKTVEVGGKAYSYKGSQRNGIDVVRSNTDGALDTSFGTNGQVSITHDAGLGWNYTSPRQFSVAIQIDGSIVMAGYCDDTYEGLARILPDGTLDPTFVGGNGAVSPQPGVVTIPLNVVGSPERALGKCMRQDPLGNLVLLGQSLANGATSHLVRLDPSGALDGSFNGGLGIVEVSIGPGVSTLLESFRPDASGNLFAVGSVSDHLTGDRTGLVVQLAPDGTPVGYGTVAIPGSVHTTEFTDLAITAGGLLLGGITDAPQLGLGRNYLIVKYP